MVSAMVEDAPSGTPASEGTGVLLASLAPSPTFGPLASATPVRAKAVPGSSPSASPTFGAGGDPVTLPPALDWLDKPPAHIKPGELQAYREENLAWRAGQAEGARGEIVDRCSQEPKAEEKAKVPCSPMLRSATDAAFAAAACQNGEDEEEQELAYFSEPERDVTWSSPGSEAVWRRGGRSPSLRLGLDRLLGSAEKCPKQVPPRGARATGPVAVAGAIGPQLLDFRTWLGEEVRGAPDESQLGNVKRSHLREVFRVPGKIEKLLGFGFLLCLDILLHELSFTPVQVARALPRLLSGRRAPVTLKGASAGHAGPWRLTVTEQCDLIRLTLLILNVLLVSLCFDVSVVYHYIRGESFLKLYVIFNMLEMFERWVRSGGCDLVDFLTSSVRHPWRSLLPKYFATLLYCFLHSTMHYLRVLLLNVAINTSSSAVFLIITTNNFGEIKSTVFKRYEEKSLFPIITSDIVERFYLVLDIIFVLARLAISPHRGTYDTIDIARWLFLLVAIELGTDWIKFCLIVKFSEMQVKTIDVYKEVLIADILLSRSRIVAAAPLSEAQAKKEPPPAPPVVPFRGIHSFSHVPARRIGFSGVPMTTLVLLHVAMMFRAPCSAALRWPQATTIVFLVVLFLLGFLAKVLLGAVLLGFAARRRGAISKGLELYPKIKAL